MNRNNLRSLQLNISGLSFWIALFVIIWLLGSIGLGWLVKSIFILIGLFLLMPILLFLGLRFWLQRNLVESSCPVCGNNVVGLKNTQTRCMNCGEPLQGKSGRFERVTPPGTVDVDVVEVSARELEGQSDD